MLGWAMDEWLAITEGFVGACSWDESLLFHFMPDEHTLVFQVRKSPLSFIIKQQAVDQQLFTISYTGYEPGAARDATMRRFGFGPARPAPAVSAELEGWLRSSVARYVAESGVPD